MDGDLINLIIHFKQNQILLLLSSKNPTMIREILGGGLGDRLADSRFAVFLNLLAKSVFTLRFEIHYSCGRHRASEG